MADKNSTKSGKWSENATWAEGAPPTDGQSVIIGAGHVVELDVDMSPAGLNFTTGIAGLTITGSNTTPAALVAATSGAGGTLYMKSATNIAGSTGAVTYHGRIIANSDQAYATTTALPYATKFIIQFLGTAAGYLDGTHLDLNLRCAEPTNRWVTTYGTHTHTVESIATDTGIITITSHGFAANDMVSVRVNGAGTLPAGLHEDAMYYVRAVTTHTFKLALTNADTYLLPITSSGTGTIEVFNGQAASTATVNVREDVRSDPQWSTTDGLDYVCVRSTTQLQLSTINETSLVLSGNTGAIGPHDRIYLATRNVAIRSESTNVSSNIVVYPMGTMNCEIRSIAGSYCRAINQPGVGFSLGGIVIAHSDMYTGFYGFTLTGILLASTQYGIFSFTGGVVDITTTGVVEAESLMVQSTLTRYIVDGEIRRKGITSNMGTAPISGSGKFWRCGVNQNVRLDFSGTIVNAPTGIWGCLGVFRGTIAACTSAGLFYSSVTLDGATVIGCAIGVASSDLKIRGTTFSNNTIDLSDSTVNGVSTSLGSVTQVSNYKQSTIFWPPTEARTAAFIQNLATVTGAIGCWTQGGFTKSATYASGTHGTPPITAPNSLVHETTFEDSDRVNYVEFPVRVPANKELSVTLYGALTGHAAFTTMPSIGIYDPAQPWQGVDEDLDVELMADGSTDWQTLTATHTPTVEKELNIRMQGIGGNAGGTGTEKLYWFNTMRIGGLPADPNAIKWTTVVSEEGESV